MAVEDAMQFIPPIDMKYAHPTGREVYSLGDDTEQSDPRVDVVGGVSTFFRLELLTFEYLRHDHLGSWSAHITPTMVVRCC